MRWNNVAHVAVSLFYFLLCLSHRSFSFSHSIFVFLIQDDEAEEAEDEDEEEEEEEEPRKPAAKQSPVQYPPSKSRDRAPPEGITTAFEDLVLSETDDNDDSMVALFHHSFCWSESENPTFTHHTRFARKRCTTDVVMYGLTNPRQVDCHVLPCGKKVKIVFRIQDEFLTSRRQLIHVDGCGLGAGLTDMQAALSNRATSHQMALNDLIAKHDGSVDFTTIINLPVECESQFTTRDDQGNEAAREGLAFGCYEQDYQLDDFPPQFMHLLHIQLLVKETVVARSVNPAGMMFSPAAAAARRQQQQFNQFQQQQQQQQQQRPQYNYNYNYVPPPPPQPPPGPAPAFSQPPAPAFSQPAASAFSQPAAPASRPAAPQQASVSFGGPPAIGGTTHSLAGNSNHPYPNTRQRQI